MVAPCQVSVSRLALPDQPAYRNEIEKEVEGMEPPVFATQGEAAGKARGRPKAKATPKRKPREKAPAKAKAKASRSPKTKGKKGGKPKAKSAPKSKASKRSAKPEAAAAPEKAPRAAPSKARKRPAELDAAPCPVLDVVAAEPAKKGRARKSLPAHAKDAEPRVPPSHVTHNHIYSSAYRKALSQYPGDKEKARQIGKEAVEFFKSTGTVNSLCGEFRSSRRSSVAAPRDDGDTA